MCVVRSEGHSARCSSLRPDLPGFVDKRRPSSLTPTRPQTHTHTHTRKRPRPTWSGSVTRWRLAPPLLALLVAAFWPGAARAASHWDAICLVAGDGTAPVAASPDQSCGAWPYTLWTRYSPVARDYMDTSAAKLLVWVHVGGFVLLACFLPVQWWRKKGTAGHVKLGTVLKWAYASMVTTGFLLVYFRQARPCLLVYLPSRLLPPTAHRHRPALTALATAPSLSHWHASLPRPCVLRLRVRACVCVVPVWSGACACAPRPRAYARARTRECADVRAREPQLPASAPHPTAASLSKRHPPASAPDPKAAPPKERRG